MADITLCQSIDGSLTNSDLKDANGYFYDEYNIKLTDDRGVTFTTERPTSVPSGLSVSVIDTATGDYNMYGGSGGGTILRAGDYKVRVDSSTLGNYKLSTTDDGRITSFVSVLPTIKGFQEQGGFISVLIIVLTMAQVTNSVSTRDLEWGQLNEHYLEYLRSLVLQQFRHY